MERKIRSRGIRIFYNFGHTVCKEKIYYEPDEKCSPQNEYVAALQEKGLISLFEYSTVENKIDTYNYHVSVPCNNYEEIYNCVSPTVIDSFKNIKVCFGDCMRNYTIGYKMNGSVIEQQNFYYYPTIWMENRYKIKGITEQNIINNNIAKFASIIIENHEASRTEISSFAKMLYEFRGISVHASKNLLGYKIYGRIDENILKNYLMENYNYNIGDNVQYGKCILTSLRISDGQVQGVNIYYLGIAMI